MSWPQFEVRLTIQSISYGKPKYPSGSRSQQYVGAPQAHRRTVRNCTNEWALSNLWDNRLELDVIKIRIHLQLYISERFRLCNLYHVLHNNLKFCFETKIVERRCRIDRKLEWFETRILLWRLLGKDMLKTTSFWRLYVETDFRKNALRLNAPVDSLRKKLFLKGWRWCRKLDPLKS